MPQESLSALFDGECSDAEIDRLLASLETSPELARRWSRWHLRREMEDGTRVAPGQACICAGVMAAIADPVNQPTRKGSVVDLSAWGRRIVAMPWKPTIGFAAAASMGAAAVLFLSPQHGIDSVGGSSESGGSMVRVGNSFNVPGARNVGRLRSVSLTGDNPGPTFADEEYAELLRDYVAASRQAYAETGFAGGMRNARLDVHASEMRTAAESDAKR